MEPSPEEESIHGEAWHDQYFHHADFYKGLVDTVCKLARHEPARKIHNFEPLPKATSNPFGKGSCQVRLHHALSHAGAAALDVESRSIEADLTYVPLSH